MSIVASLCVAAVAAGGKKIPGPIAYDSFKHGKAYYHVVTADLSSGMVSAGTVHSPHLTSVWKLLAEGTPTVAITGTFFSPQGGQPVADVLVDGDLVASGERGSAIGVDWYGGVNIFDTRFGQNVDWDKYRFGLRGAVRVVTDGKVRPNPKAQKFRDRRIWGSAARTAVGLSKHGKLVLVATKNSVTLSQLGKAMVSRGITDGVSLDGGGSTCMYYRGSMLISPNRKLSNMFVISQKAPY
jgi:hypothetical protein